MKKSCFCFCILYNRCYEKCRDKRDFRPDGDIKGGSFTVELISEHTKTNIEVIKKFLTVDFQIEQKDKCFKVSCLAKA
jgi:hypothetical protein